MFYLSYLMGEYSPHNNPGARVYFIGMTVDASREEMTQAVSGGMVYGLRDSLEMVRSLGIHIDRIKTCGGGAENPLWKRMATNVMNVRVDVVENRESPALEGVILTAVGCKEYPGVKTIVGSIVKMTETTKPDGELTEKYEKQYSKFGQMYPALKAVFQNSGE